MTPQSSIQWIFLRKNCWDVGRDLCSKVIVFSLLEVFYVSQVCQKIWRSFEGDD